MNFVFYIIKMFWYWFDKVNKEDQINKIDPYDERYELLSRIPLKEVNPKDGLVFVYLTINDEKDYFITYKDFEMQIQTLGYDTNNNSVYFIDGHCVPL